MLRNYIPFRENFVEGSIIDTLTKREAADHTVHKGPNNTACTRLDCYRHLHKYVKFLIAPGNGVPIHFLGEPAVGSRCLAGSSPHKSGDVKSNPGPTTHTLQSFGLVTFAINQTQTPIICNHTHNTQWVYLKCTQIKQRQYTFDWRCTIHTPT